jgi:hypothetical protein
VGASRRLREAAEEHFGHADLLPGQEEAIGSLLDGHEARGAAAGGSPVSPATEGPAQNPPSHGVPTNPAQPRR